SGRHPRLDLVVAETEQRGAVGERGADVLGERAELARHRVDHRLQHGLIEHAEPEAARRARPARGERPRVEQRAVDVEQDVGHGRVGYPAASRANRAARRGRLTRISSATTYEPITSAAAMACAAGDSTARNSG